MNKEFILRHFHHMPVLNAERIILRKILPSDYKDMYEYSSREDVTRYLLWNCHPNAEYTKQYLEYIQDRYKMGDFYDWAISLKDKGKMIGTCGFTKFDYSNNSAEIGYVLNPEYWGKGYALEAVREVICYGFNELKLNRIEARYIAENNASRRVMERCGMKFEGVMRSSVFNKGKYWDVGVYAIIKN